MWNYEKGKRSRIVNIKELEPVGERAPDNAAKLEPDETGLVGTWKREGNRVVEDPTARRINWLTENCLNKVSADESGWNILYQDPGDKRYWELVYPNSQMQGGGAPALINLSEQEAKSKYRGLSWQQPFT